MIAAVPFLWNAVHTRKAKIRSNRLLDDPNNTAIFVVSLSYL
jgi:hypothetical protein